MRLLAQADDVQLLPDTAELVWGVAAFLILVGLLGGMVYLVMSTARSRRRQDERLRRLEQRVDQMDPED